MTLRVFIDGAAGTTGLEIMDRLAPRSEFDLIVLDDEQRKSADADPVEALAAGVLFAVLDVAGGWAWGQAIGESGPVGYVVLDQLEAPA